MIQLTNLKKSFSDRELFSALNLNISNQSKIGLVGRNGSGKSTIFKMIKGELSPDDGGITISKGYKIN